MPFCTRRSDQLNECDSFTAANWAGLGILYNNGQDCTAGSRLFVQDSIYDKFMAILVKKVQELVVSHGFNEKASAGPVVRSQSLPFWSCSLVLLREAKSAAGQRYLFVLITNFFVRCQSHSMNVSGTT